MEEKKCPQCDSFKPLSEFSRDKARKDGLQCYCKPCKAKYARACPTRPEVARKSRFRRQYGIEGDDLRVVDAIKFCAICYGPAEVIDHCHTSGKVRGVLCNGCNTTLGKMHDSPELLRRAAEYLEQEAEPNTYGVWSNFDQLKKLSTGRGRRD